MGKVSVRQRSIHVYKCSKKKKSKQVDFDQFLDKYIEFINEIKKDEYELINSFIKVAHRHNCKVHGLGFTRTRNMSEYHFDSVDSTSWKSGGLFGQLHTFDGKAIETSKPQTRMHWKEIDSHNLTEWNKYVEYADKNL